MCVQSTIKKQLAEPVELHLNRPSAQMWDKILQVFRDVLGKAESSYLSKATSKYIKLLSYINFWC